MERISNGLFASFLSILITKRKIKNTKNSYQLLDDISDCEINNLSKAVKKMKVYNKTEIKKINNHDKYEC